MSDDLAIDEDLVHRLPLPLAQLYRRAHNAKSSQERHQAAYFLWEAALKLLASAAVVQYVALDRRDGQIEPKLENLSRPAVGHWWQFVRLLVPLLAEAQVPRFAAVRDLLLGRTRDDLPRAAGLDCLLSASDPLRPPARSTVSLSELFHRLVSYRNREIGHGAAGMRRDAIYDRYGRALLAGLAQVLQQLDVLAGGRLLFIDDVSRQPSGGWLVKRYELLGETPQRLESLELPETMTSHLPRPQQVYLELPDARAPVPGSLGWLSLHPLVIYDDDTREVFFLNGAQGQRQASYLSYTSGAQCRRDALVADQRRLLAHVLGREVADDELSVWAARSQADDPPPPEKDMPGQHRVMGEFELLSELGHGGMGIVYRAFQPSLGRQVALKCLQRAGDPKSEARFAREIRVLGRVDHPHLVKIHTSGCDAEQHWYFAMELVDGAELASVCERLSGSSSSDVSHGDWQSAISTACQQARTRERALSDTATDPSKTLPEPTGPAVPVEASGTPPTSPVAAAQHSASVRAGESHIAQAVELVRQVALAAHALHEVGVVHRDIKPGNIMVTPEGDHAVLMDLGLAQLADESEGRLTRTRQFVGTLRYASFEQVLATERLDRRADVYSLGATLWELLTLRPLFGAGDHTPTPELMNRIMLGDVESPRKHNPQVPVDLAAVALKCLEKDKARRYATAQDLAADLARWQHDEPVVAQPASLRYVLGKYARRHKLPLAMAAAAAACIVLAVIGAFIGITQSRDAAILAGAVAARERDHAQAAETHLQAANGRLSEQLHRAAASIIEWGLTENRSGRSDRALALFIGARATAPPDDSLRAAAANLAIGYGASAPASLRHDNNVVAVAFSPDGRTLATAGGQSKGGGAARLWDVASGKPRGEPLQHDEPVRAVAFSPDGRTLATASEESARLWELPADVPAELLDDYAAVRSGWLVDSTGVLRPLSAAEADEHWKSLAEHGGDWLAAEAQRFDERTYWFHRYEADAAEHDKSWYAAAFYLGKLLDQSPDDADQRARHKRALANVSAAAPADADAGVQSK